LEATYLSNKYTILLSWKSFNFKLKLYPEMTATFHQNYYNISISDFNIGEVSENTWGVAQKQQRAHEDRYQVKQIGPYRYFAVFDGHGGSNKMDYNHVGDYTVNNLHLLIADRLQTTNLDDINEVSSALTQLFVDFDNEMHYRRKLFGTTCTILLIDDIRGYIYQINLGDSRSIIFDVNGIISATDDHQPYVSKEEERITTAGGFVAGNRIMGYLMVSRSFGDFDLKQNNNIEYDPIDGMVSAVPDIKIISF
jgi:serine/threonine protein phosphatase PrpC